MAEFTNRSSRQAEQMGMIFDAVRTTLLRLYLDVNLFAIFDGRRVVRNIHGDLLLSAPRTDRGALPFPSVVTL